MCKDSILKSLRAQLNKTLVSKKEKKQEARPGQVRAVFLLVSFHQPSVGRSPEPVPDSGEQ